MRTILELRYDWHQVEGSEDYYVAKVGEKGVVSIEQHAAQGEGDKWFYDIHREDGTMTRIFNPSRVIFSKEEV